MKRSKVLSLLLAVMMVIGTMSCMMVVAEAAIVAEDGIYDDEGNLEEAYWQLESDGTLTIFKDCDPTWSSHRNEISRIVLAAGVTTIPNSAFVGCNNLTELNLDSSLVAIEAGAFQGLTSLQRVYVACVEQIGDYAFYNCDNLTEVYIGGGLAEGCVGENVFKNCDNLQYVWLGNGSREIGYGMFEDCVSLVTASIPDSLCVIGAHAFDGCSSLTAVTIPDSTTTVGGYAFYDCTSVESISIGHKAEEFGEFVFGNNTSLKTVSIGSAMSVITKGMFYGCSSLESFSGLPQGIETIGDVAFMGCSSLAVIELPASVTMIGASAFDGTAITSFNVPWNVTSIGDGAFTNCASLENITVDAKNTSYAAVDGALYDITLDTILCCPAGKTGTYIINEGTQKIADDAFIGCTGLTVIEAPDSVDVIADNAFNACSADLVIKTGCVTKLAEFASKHGITTELVHSSETKWIETVAPTCEVSGEKANVCADCEYVFVTESVDALGHEYDTGVVTKKATCDEDGVVTITCTRTDCGDSYTEVLPATNHKYDDGVVVLEPTCEATGIKRFTCQNEGCYHYYDIDVPATGHNYTTTVTKAPTCTEEGVETTTCDRCGNFTTASIPATGHSYNEGVVTVEATCDADGELTFTCLSCGDSYTEVIPAIGHDYVESVVKPATCIEAGKNVSTCQNCGDSHEYATTGEHQKITATVNPTCETAGKSGEWCVICNSFVGEVNEIPATGHTYKDGKCTSCGKADPNSADSSSKVRPATPKMKLIKNEVKGISVTWSAVDGAKYYRVYRRGAGEKYWTYITNVTGNSYLDTNAETGKFWRYTVRAVGTNGLYSGYENGIYIKRVDTPSMKKLTNTANGINVTWSAVSNAQEYRVYRRGAGEKYWTYVTTVTGTSYLDTAVKNANGQYFRYTVRAVDGYYSGYESGIYTKRVTTK